MDQFLTAPIVGAGAGWAAFGGLAIYVVRMIVTGGLITRRESDADKAQIVSLKATNAAQSDQIGVLVETTKPFRNLLNSLMAQGSE